jgi:hypothetical protein
MNQAQVVRVLGGCRIGVNVSRKMLGGWSDGCFVGPEWNLVRGWGSEEPNSAAEIAGVSKLCG